MRHHGRQGGYQQKDVTYQSKSERALDGLQTSQILVCNPCADDRRQVTPERVDWHPLVWPVSLLTLELTERLQHTGSQSGGCFLSHAQSSRLAGKASPGGRILRARLLDEIDDCFELAGAGTWMES